jgi:hypothetical protein
MGYAEDTEYTEGYTEGNIGTENTDISSLKTQENTDISSLKTRDENEVEIR